MAVKKQKVDPRAMELKAVREQLKELEEKAKQLRSDLLKDFGPGRYEGFVVIERSRNTLDKDALEKKYGDLSNFLKASTALYIEFV